MIKSLCLKIMLVLYKKNMRIEDLFYALSCFELVNKSGNKTETMQGINPMLFIKKSIKECLNLLDGYNLIYVQNHILKLSVEGLIFIDSLKENSNNLVKEYLNKIECINDNYREKYYVLLEKEKVLNVY